MYKTCDACHQNKNINNFHKNGNCTIDGHLNQCKKCVSERRKIYRNANKEKISLQGKRWRTKNKEYKKERDKMYSQTERGKETHRKARLRWIRNNPEKNKESKRKWKQNNKLKINQQLCDRRKKDESFNILSALRKRLNKAVKKQYKLMSSRELLGCSVSFLKKHLERKFTSGMAWNNYGRDGWHIDHIIPCSKFDLTKVANQKKCFHWTNLQPLWAKDNLTKSNH